MAVQNLCSPQNIFGGYGHHLFLGCSVMNFSASVGWGEQVGELTVALVQDPCAVPNGGNPKIYWDSALVRKTWTQADPGPYIYGLDPNDLVGPIIGAPVYFRVEDFEYCGLLQSFQEVRSQNGNPTFEAKIVDPRLILEGTELIIGGYAGSVGSVYNLFNVFGFMESFGVQCPETTPTGGDAVFGTPAGGFGGASVNDNGMQWNLIKPAVGMLTSAFPRITNAFSPYGRLVYKGSQIGGFGMMPSDRFDFNIALNFGDIGLPASASYHDGYLSDYFIDLTDVPDAPSYWRVSGTNVKLLEVIQQVCDAAGCDFYIELVPVTFGSQIIKIIKVRTVSRAAQPRLDAIQGFIDANPVVPGSRKGREARNEVTQSFLVGGRRQIIFQVAQENADDNDYVDDIIVPYWGLDPSTGYAIESTKDENNQWNFEASVAELNTHLRNPMSVTTVTLTEGELQAALAGVDAWFSYSSMNETDLYNAFNDANGGEYEGLLKNAVQTTGIAAADVNKLNPKDFINLTTKAFKGKEDEALKDREHLYEFVRAYATEYYGRKFMVRIPYTCRRTDSENGLVETSEVPSDGGWTDTSTVLGLEHPSALTDFFGLEDGRLGCFVKYTDASAIDASALDPQEVGILGTSLYVKGSLEQDLVYMSNDTPRVVVNINQAVTLKNDEFTDAQVAGNMRIMEAQNAFDTAKEGGTPGEIATAAEKLLEVVKKVGGDLLSIGLPYAIQLFDQAAVPLKSNIHTYGPWITPGPPGVVQFNQDEGLVPWEYGGSTVMNLAGNALVNQGITYMQAGEMGDITVAGYPDRPMGSELGATFGEGAFHVIENRSILDNNFNGNDAGTGGQVDYNYFTTNGELWNGQYGPNITNINVQVGTEGITTNYQMRTFTPKLGRFSRQNAQRLKQIGSLRLKQQKQFRLAQLQQRQALSALARAEDKRGIQRGRGDAINNGGVRTPHEVLVGQLSEWRDKITYRTTVTTDAITSVGNELSDNYSSKAFMSLDGLLRPVSINGDGGLPSFTDPSGNCYLAASKFYLTPINEGNSGPSQYTQSITSTYLNPFSNPNEGAGSREENSGEVGHDIEIVGSGTSPSSTSMIGVINGYGEDAEKSYASDYRFLALRGPLIIHGWGYDIDGKPVPNSAGAGGQADTFADDFLGAPDTWPVGPVDLRWDRDRGVWTVPTPGLLVVEFEGNVQDSGVVRARVTNGGTIYDSTGSAMSNPKIDVYSITPVETTTSGNKGIAWYDSRDCKYYLIHGQDAGSGSGSGDSGVSGSGSGVCTIGGFHISEIAGYNEGARQYLSHGVSGCLEWITPVECSGSG